MTRLIALTLCWCLLVPGVSGAVAVQDYPYLGALIDRLVAEHGLDRGELVRTFDRVTLRPEVLEAIQRPAERLPWHRYRSFFVNPAQIENGAAFWRRHERVLERAASETGVPPEIIVSIIGIETRYGATLGSHPVLDSLTTLALQYPRRQKFFGSELENFLLLANEHSLDPLAIRGSYAGAIGIPQFMPSSYREYAVDFSGDGKADLVNQTEDAIGSVANYLTRFEWRPGQPVSVRVDTGSVPDSAPSNQREPSTTVSDLHAMGVELNAGVAGDARAGLVRLDGEDATRYSVAFDNFYVIMRYNPSFLYAMAVNDLSDALKKEYGGS